MNEGKKWICKKQFRRITVGTIVYIQPIGVGHFSSSYAITPEDSNRTRITNSREMLEYFKEFKES